MLAKEYLSLMDGVNWTMVEANPNVYNDIKVKLIKGFFDSTFELRDKVDVFVHSHVFEHMYEPNEFISNISGFLNKDELHILSIPRMQVMLEQGYTNCINFEHTFLLTEIFIDFI